MEYIPCGRGHFYSPEQNKTCPECAKENAAQSEYTLNDIGKTEPVGAFTDEGFTVTATPYVGPTQPVDRTEPVGSVGKNVQPYPKTLPVGFQEDTVAMPVVGWLVCVEGAAKGRDYRIHSQNNFIGRARHMDICIEGDNTISAEKAAVLAYDDQGKTFYLAPGDGMNLVRLNGQVVLMTAKLQPYDVLTIGKTRLMFIPFCGERFNWNET